MGWQIAFFQQVAQFPGCYTQILSQSAERDFPLAVVTVAISEQRFKSHHYQFHNCLLVRNAAFLALVFYKLTDWLI